MHVARQSVSQSGLQVTGVSGSSVREEENRKESRKREGRAVLKRDRDRGSDRVLKNGSLRTSAREGQGVTIYTVYACNDTN